MTELNEAEKRRRTQELLDVIFGDRADTLEPLHDSDCPACDLACEIAGYIAASVHFGTRVRVGREEHTGWEEPPDSEPFVPGDTRLDQAARIAAKVLHDKLPGHGGKR